MSKLTIFVFLFVFLAAPALSLADARSEINIDSNGNMSIKNLKVTMVPEPGKSKFFYARAVWDNVFIRITVLTNDKTDISKKYGEKSSVFDISDGDILNVEGALPSSSDSLNIQASKIVNLSLEKEDKEMSGEITKTTSSPPGFTMKSSSGNVVGVNILSGTVITKGVRNIGWSELAPGDIVNSIKGTFDYTNYTIEATSIDIYQDSSIFKPRNFQGTLISISGPDLPVTAIVQTEGRQYTVYFPSNAIVLNRARGNASLVRFVKDDTVRFYGAIRKNNLTEIDGEVLRNLNF
jgi:hypothetical protein